MATCFMLTTEISRCDAVLLFQEKAEVRAAAFKLFGDLTKYGNGESSEAFAEQAMNNLVTLLVHLNEDDMQVVKVGWLSESLVFFQFLSFCFRTLCSVFERTVLGAYYKCNKLVCIIIIVAQPSIHSSDFNYCAAESVFGLFARARMPNASVIFMLTAFKSLLSKKSAPTQFILRMHELLLRPVFLV